MTERAYPRTAVGAVEVKSLPSSLAFEAHGPSSGDAKRDDLFWKNYRFLKENRLEMTAPVEMGADEATMRFFVPRGETDRDLLPVPDVEVRALEERLVVAAGLRGGYSRRAMRKGERRIRRWLDEHPAYEATGPARAVYWHGPMVPPFLRRMEVHVPVAHVR